MYDLRERCSRRAQRRRSGVRFSSWAVSSSSKRIRTPATTGRTAMQGGGARGARGGDDARGAACDPRRRHRCRRGRRRTIRARASSSSRRASTALPDAPPIVLVSGSPAAPEISARIGAACVPAEAVRDPPSSSTRSAGCSVRRPPGARCSRTSRPGPCASSASSRQLSTISIRTPRGGIAIDALPPSTRIRSRGQRIARAPARPRRRAGPRSPAAPRR